MGDRNGVTGANLRKALLSLPKPAPYKRDQTFRAFLRFLKRVPRTDLGCPGIGSK